MNIQLSPLTSITTARQLNKVAIESSGIFLPERIVSSDEIMERFDSQSRYGIPIDSISKNVGILNRRVASPDEEPSSLAVKAAKQALESSGIRSVDKVVFCGITKDQDEPATAHKVCQRLNIKAKEAYDITDACFGFIRGLQDCIRSIQLGDVETALVLTGEMPSKCNNHTIEKLRKGVDLKTAKSIIGFLTAGDAGGAILLTASSPNKAKGFSDFHTEINSELWDKCFYKSDNNGGYDGQMLMGHLTAHGRRMGKALADRVKAMPGWKEPKHMLSHNTGTKSLDCLIQCGLAPKNKWFKTYEQLGNLTSATFPVNYHMRNQVDAFSENDTIGCFFNGSGLIFGYFEYTV